MDSVKLLQHNFNSKRPGALVGVITDVTDLLKLLITVVAKGKDEDNWDSQDAATNDSFGQCSVCNGNMKSDFDPRRMIAPELSMKQGAVLLWAGTSCTHVSMIKQLAGMIGIDYAKPLGEQDQRFTEILLYGYKEGQVNFVHKKKPMNWTYYGCVADLRAVRDAGTTSAGNQRAIHFFSGPIDCPSCQGTKLNPEQAALAIHDKSLLTILQMPVQQLLHFVQRLRASLDEHDRMLCEIEARLIYLNKIGLYALTPRVDQTAAFQQ